MQTVAYIIIVLLIVAGGFFLFAWSKKLAVREFVAGIAAQREMHPFRTAEAFKAHVDGKIPTVFDQAARAQITRAFVDFFAKYSLLDNEYPTVDALLARYPELDTSDFRERVNRYPEWGLFELEAHLFSTPNVWSLVDAIIDDVLKAAEKLVPDRSALLVLPSGPPNPLQAALAAHPGPAKLYNLLCIDADVIRRGRLIGADYAFQDLTAEISKVCSGVSVPNDIWFEHAFVFAPTGSGKTNVLSHFIDYRLDQVAKGGASVVVMESNRDLVMSIARLKRFAPGGDLHDRLVLVDFEDVEHPIGMNPWAMPDDRGLSQAARESLYVSTIWSLEYLYRSLLDMELTPRQATLLRYATNLLIVTPGATLDSLHRIMQPGGSREFVEFLPKTDKDTQEFFTTQFDDKENRLIGQTKQEIVARIATIKSIPALRRILNSPRTTLDLDKELALGKVILVNASQQQLSPMGVEIIGKFILGALVRAMHRRSLVARSERMDTYIFLDECQDFVKNDQSIETLLDQARKYRLSVTLASQRPEQLGEGILQALFGNAAIKMAAHLGDSAASALARNMDTKTEFIRRPPPFSFAAYVRRVTDTAVYYKAPEFDFSRQPTMDASEERALKEQMRNRYTVSPASMADVMEQTEDDPTKAAPW